MKKFFGYQQMFIIFAVLFSIALVILHIGGYPNVEPIADGMDMSSPDDASRPSLEVFPPSGDIKCQQLIAQAYAESGINHIGYVWKSDSAVTPEYTDVSVTPVYSNVANIPAPSKPGRYTLHVYAKDNSPQYNCTGWRHIKYTVVPSDWYIFNKIIKGDGDAI